MEKRLSIALFVLIASSLIIACLSLFSLHALFQHNCTLRTPWFSCNAVTGESAKIGIALLVALFTGSGAVYAWKSRGVFDLRTGAQSYYRIGALLAIFAVVSLPFASIDWQYYFGSGKAVVHGVNVFTSPWGSYSPFTTESGSSAGGFSYGPIAALIFGAVYGVSGDNPAIFLFEWKLLMLVAAGLLGYLVQSIWKSSQKKDTSQHGMPVFFWLFLPLTLVEWLANGHFDALWLLCVLFAFLCARKKIWWAVLPLVTIGVWLKFIPVIIAPWFILWWWHGVTQKNWKHMCFQMGIGSLLAIIITVVSWRPFWVGPEVFHSLVVQSKWAVSSLFSAVYYGVYGLIAPWLGSQTAHWYITRIVQGTLLVTLFYMAWPAICLAWRILWKKTGVYVEARHWAGAMFLTLLLFQVLWQKSWWPWYVLWLMPFGMLSLSAATLPRMKRILGWLMAAPLLFYTIWLIGLSSYGVDLTPRLWFNIVVVLLVSAYPLVELVRWRQENFAGLLPDNQADE